MAQEKEAVEACVAIALSKVEMLCSEMVDAVKVNSLCNALMVLAEKDPRHSIFHCDDQLFDWAWSRLQQSPCDGLHSADDMQVLESNVIGDGTSASSNPKDIDKVPFAHLLGCWVRYDSDDCQKHNGCQLRRNQECQVIAVHTAQMKLRGEGMGGPFWSGFHGWVRIPAKDSTGQGKKTEIEVLPRSSPRRLCVSCRVSHEDFLKKLCSECRELLNRNWSDNVMEVSINEATISRVEVIYRINGVVKPHKENCRVKDIPEKVMLKRKTHAYVNAQKRLESHNRFGASGVRGESSSSSSHNWNERTTQSLCRSTTSSVGDSWSYPFSVPYFPYPPVTCPWFPYQPNFVPMTYPWFPYPENIMGAYVHNGACDNSLHALEDASQNCDGEAPHPSSSFYPPPGLDLAQPDDHNQVQVNKVDRTVAQLDDDTTCVVCMDNKKDHIVVPCGHLCICGSCKDGVQASAKCPMCRDKLTFIMQVYK